MNIDDKAWFAELNIAVETRCRPDLDDIDAANIVTCIESLLAENERLNHNLTSTEQTMREYQELAATRLEEIAKYRDAPVVAWSHLVKGLTFVETYAGSKPLIVKPGEEK